MSVTNTEKKEKRIKLFSLSISSYCLLLIGIPIVCYSHRVALYLPKNHILRRAEKKEMKEEEKYKNKLNIDTRF